MTREVQRWTSVAHHFAVHPESDEVHVWRVRISAAAVDCDAILADEEQERAARFRLADDRRQFAVTRALLRTLLGRYLKQPPRSLMFRYSDFGKPLLDPSQNPAGITFNVAHSGDRALLAFGSWLDVGVDIEDLRIERGVAELAEAILTPAEHRRLLALPEARRKAEFLQTWTRREALAKGLGVGLSVVTGSSPPAMPDSAGWSICDIDAGEGYVAAVAARTGCARLRLLDHGA